MTLLMRFVS
ncbi:peptide deformylase, partial [Chlamydia psittaci 84-8471/1]